jgi:hypothetical protein
MAKLPQVPSEASHDAAPEANGFAIRLPSAQLGDLIQINCMNRVRGAFRVSSGPHEGHLFFEHGQLIHAAFGQVTGLDAVILMLGWKGGSVEPCRVAWPKESTINMGADALLLHAAQRIDERAMPSPPRPEEATTKVVRRVTLPPAGATETSEPTHGEASKASSPSMPPTAEALRQLQIVQVDVDGTIQQLKAGASRDLADTAFFCQRMATMVGETLGLGECRALSIEGKREGIVVFKGKSIVGTRGQSEELAFILERVGLA